MIRNITSQDISWFLDLFSRSRLDLDPPYQRKSVWAPRERRFFLDTVFSGYPCPPVFLHKSLSDEGVATYHVVDGKQRLETIIKFAANEIALPDDMQDERLQGKRWKGLDGEQRRYFWNYQIAVELLDAVDNAIVREIFDRYNRTSKNLERQELRHARYDGWLSTTAVEEAKKDEWRQLGIVTTATARRMRDVQFISELMILVLKGEIFGFSQVVLDEYYADYDVPGETDPTFSEGDFVERFERVKRWVLALEETDSVVTEFSKSSTNFFSLWSLVTLHHDQLPDHRVFAARYRAFMEQVAKLLKTDTTPEEFAHLAEQHPYPFSYAQNARGANTDFPQRQERHRALVSALLDPAEL
ncbi:MAG: DUF262 domain-containing protein [Longimicrobiaceae bacterium]